MAGSGVETMKIKDLWNQYGESGEFNISSLPRELLQKGSRIEFEPNFILVSRGEFPRHIYFIQQGIVAGIREYKNGNAYHYFQLDHTNGSIGLLELLARQEKYIATIITKTRVTAIKIDSATVYGTIMNDLELLRKCTFLLAEDLYKRSGNDGLLYYMAGLDRVRFFLASYYEAHSGGAKGQIFLAASYQDIANEIGMSLRTVGRNIQKLKSLGEIKSIRKKIAIGQAQYERMIKNIYL